MQHNVVVNITNHKRTYLGLNGEILDGPKGKPIGTIQNDDKVSNQTTNPTEARQEGEDGTVEDEKGKK